MHELSISQSVVRTVTDALPGRTVRRVTLRIGVASGVVPEALAFAWDVVTAGTSLDGAALDVVRLPLAVACRSCGTRAELDANVPVRCPGCTGRDVEVTGGRELEVGTVEVADELDRIDDAPAGVA